MSIWSTERELTSLILYTTLQITNMTKNFINFIGPISLGLALYAGFVYGKSRETPVKQETETNQRDRRVDRSTFSQTPLKTTKKVRKKKKALGSKSFEFLHKKDALARMKALVKIVDTWHEDDLKLLLQEYVRKGIVNFEKMEVNVIVDALIESKPEVSEALDYLQSTYGNNGYGLLRYGIISAARINPDAARTWARNLPVDNRYDRLYMLSDLALGAADTDPERAMELHMEVTDRATRGNTIEKLSAKLAHAPLDTTWDWYIKNHSTRLNELIKNLPPRSRAEAAERLEKLDDEEVKLAGGIDLAQIWPGSDPKAAMNWIEKLPLKLGGRLASYAVENLGDVEPNELIAWSEKFKGNRWYRSHIHKHVILHIAAKDPERAAKLFSDYKGWNRSYMREQIYEKWRKVDENAAGEFVELDKKLHKK